MTTDKNKEIQSISCNHLNLPVEVVKKSGDKLKFTYTATGQKLSQEITYSNGDPKKTIDYAGPHYYENKNLLFVSTGEGRVVMKSTPEYQYYLKDHLGNNRVVLTTKKETKTTRATLETAYTNTEGSNFVNYQRAVKINATIFDHTKKGPTYYSSRLSGTAREKYGLARSLSVMPGDKVWAEVFAKYLDTNQGNRTTALNNFLAGTAPGGTIVDGRFTGQIQEPTQVIVGKNNNGLAPKAYLNWLIFDRSYNYISGGFRQISTTAREYGQNCAHEQLSSGEIKITQPGYVYFYLSNENLTPVEVYFDDFKVSHTKSPIVQTNEYYPFGMTYNSHSRENSTPQRFKFQGQENIDDLKLNWDAFQWRNYSSETGRFFNVDPLADKFPNQSSYSAFNNNPIYFIDPDGREAMPLDDYLIRKNGEIIVKKTNDQFDRFYTESSQSTEGNMSIRTYTLAAQLNKNDAGLVNFPDNGVGFTSYGDTETGGFSTGIKKGVAFKENVGSDDSYLKPQTAAALLGVIHELNRKSITISLGDMSSSNGSDPADGGASTFHHAGHGHMGKRSGLDIDFRYIGNDGNSFRGVMSDKNFNLSNNKAVYDAASRFGFDPKNTYQGTSGSIPGVTTMGGHNNHGHLGFKRSPSNFINYTPYRP